MRYQCPFCHGIHRTEDTPVCAVHGRGHARGCDGCARAAQLIPCRRTP